MYTVQSVEVHKAYPQQKCRENVQQLCTQDASMNRGMYELGNVFSGDIRTREIYVSQIGMKPGSHTTGNARKRKCIEKLQRRLDFS